MTNDNIRRLDKKNTNAFISALYRFCSGGFFVFCIFLPCREVGGAGRVAILWPMVAVAPPGHHVATPLLCIIWSLLPWHLPHHQKLIRREALLSVWQRASESITEPSWLTGYGSYFCSLCAFQVGYVWSDFRFQSVESVACNYQRVFLCFQSADHRRQLISHREFSWLLREGG